MEGWLPEPPARLDRGRAPSIASTKTLAVVKNYLFEPIPIAQLQKFEFSTA
jgi:hypothetical protein